MNIIYRSLFFILLVSFVKSPFTTVAQNTDTLSVTLQEAIQQGLEKNYQIKIAKYETGISEINNSWGNAGRFPMIMLGANQGNRYDNRSLQPQSDGRSKATTHSLAPYVNLQWTLFDGFAVNISKHNFDLLQQMSEGQAMLTVENTVQSIILAYYTVLLEKEKLGVVREVMQLSKDRYQYMLAKQELGAAVTFDVLQEKNAFLSDSSTFLLQKLNFENAQRNLSLLLADTTNTTYWPVDSFYFETEDYLLVDLVQRMELNNQTLKNQYINQKVLENRISMSKSALYPTVALNAGYDYSNSWVRPEATDNYSSYNFDYYANLSLTYNIFTGGAIKRSIQIAEINAIIGQTGIEEIRHTMLNRLTNQYELYRARQQMYQVAVENLKSAALNLEIAQEKYKTGAINSFNYRDIQLIYLNTAISKLQATYSLIEAHTELVRLTGGMLSAYP